MSSPTDRPSAELVQSPIDSTWNRSLLRPLLIATLIAALLSGPLYIAERLAPLLTSGYALPLLFLVALEAVHITTWLAHPDRRHTRTVSFRAAELVLWLLLLRLLIWLWRGAWPDFEQVRLWFWRPLTFFDLEFVVIGCLLVLAWLLSIRHAADFLTMALQPDELTEPPDERFETDWRAPLSYTTSRQTILARFSRRWSWGGALLILCAAATQVQLRPGAGLGSLGLLALPLPPLIIAALLVYLLVGLVLLSVGRLAVLRAEWQIEHIPGGETVTRHWPRVTVLLLLLIGGLAALMPLGSTWRLGTWLQIGLVAIVRAVTWLAGYVLGLLTLALRWLASLTGRGQQPQSIESVPPSPVEPPLQAPPPVLALPEWLGSVLLWLPVAAIAVYALMTILRQVAVRVDSEWLKTVWQRLWGWWRAVRRLAHQKSRAAIQAWVARRSRARIGQAAGRGRAGFLRWRQLSPAAQIRLLYLFMARRAGARGVGRPPDHTPYEYAPRLEACWPTVEKELETMTQAFVDARYSGRVITSEEAQEVHRVWRRVRSAIREHPPGEQQG